MLQEYLFLMLLVFFDMEMCGMWIETTSSGRRMVTIKKRKVAASKGMILGIGDIKRHRNKDDWSVAKMSIAKLRGE